MFLTENVAETVAETVVETVAEAAEAVSSRISVGEAGIYALLGYAVVFFGLILLMLVIMALGKAFSAKEAAPAAAVSPAPAAPRATAPGSAGELKLHDVEPKTAAMIMAIVADKLGKPLNELRFKSIKEVK